MSRIIEVAINPSDQNQDLVISQKIAEILDLPLAQLPYFRILKKSLDARKAPMYRLRIELSDTPFIDQPAYKSRFKDDVSNSEKSVVIIGAGPAGYFAALECLLLGIKPIVLDRGKAVQDRRRDLRLIQQFHTVPPDSNYCYGEGGAGTYSDGKLYTRSVKRGDIYKVLSLLVEHGATSEIMIDAHPHIGSNHLPKVIETIRESILQHGGEIHFGQRVVDIEIKHQIFKSVITQSGSQFVADACILATGHSSRDIFRLLADKNLVMEAKSFALGVRIEHPQEIVDSAQYHTPSRPEHLPPASYSMACTLDERGVFSFCMCPGGLMVPAATSPGEIVLNGMSLSRRDSRYANSGTVVSVHPTDFDNSSDPFCTLNFQQSVEQNIFNAGDGSQKAPAQRLTDFMTGRVSASLPESSYIPGLWSAPVHDLLPKLIIEPLHCGIKIFAKKMKGYLTEEAVVVATESRTSSPIRIPRNSLSMHPQCIGLFPCGEGAGYAGGIVSAAMDGQHCAEAAFHYLTTN